MVFELNNLDPVEESKIAQNSPSRPLLQGQ